MCLAIVGGGSVDGGLAEAVEAAEQMLEEGEFDDAAQTFAAILGEDPLNAPAFAGLARSHMAMDDLEQAEAVLNGAPAEVSSSVEIEAAFAQLELAKQAKDAGPLGELINRFFSLIRRIKRLCVIKSGLVIILISFNSGKQFP